MSFCINWYVPHNSQQLSHQTCKHLHQTAGERSVWLTVLRDILQVIPLRRVLYALPTMSAGELKEKAVLITRLDSLWSLESVRPVRISSHSFGAGIRKALMYLAWRRFYFNINRRWDATTVPVPRDDSPISDSNASRQGILQTPLFRHASKLQYPW